MKKQILTLLIVLFLGSLSLNATIWRINNIPGTDAHFTTPQAANDSSFVLDGDTLLIEGSTVSYGGATFNKKLVIIGPGYFLGQNPETQANLATADLTTVTFSSGSDTSILVGISFMGGSNSTLTINANAVTIQRCYLNAYTRIAINANNTLILQNYINTTNSYDVITVGDGIPTTFIQNNFINSYYSTSYEAIIITGTSTAIISNNIIYGYLTLRNSTFTNNILRAGVFNDNTNNTITNNICNATQFPAGTNMQNVNMDSVFVGTGTTDSQWQIKDTSFARTYGVDNAECGIFGGVNPYVLSGMPPVPSVYYFSAPSTVSSVSGLPVSIKIKTNK